MGRPHWTAGESERRAYRSSLNQMEVGELKQKALEAERSGDYMFARDLYQAAGDSNGARRTGILDCDRSKYDC